MWRDIERRAEGYGFFAKTPVPYPLSEFDLANQIAILGLNKSWGVDYVKLTYKKWFQEGKEPAIEPSISEVCKELKLNNEVANTIARDEKLSAFFQEALQLCDFAVTLANIVANEVARELKDKEVTELKFTAQEIAELVKMVDNELISNKIAKQVFEIMAKSGENPTKIVEEKGLMQISDPAKIAPIIDDIIAKNPDNVTKFKAGNTKLLGFFVGQVLKATGGKANPKVVNELVATKLRE